GLHEAKPGEPGGGGGAGGGAQPPAGAPPGPRCAARARARRLGDAGRRDVRAVERGGQEQPASAGRRGGKTAEGGQPAAQAASARLRTTRGEVTWPTGAG